MAQLAFEMCNIEGKQSFVADALSRSIGEAAGDEDENDRHAIVL